MDDRRPALTPWTIEQLLDRIHAEWTQRSEIFGLAGRRFFAPVAGIDLSVPAGGGRVATPVGPAAGPHTQLAQNIVLAWLAGARSFELKTVQVIDDLDIPRPCIDMEHVGYNVEWSQELSLEQSLEEYAKAALLLAVLRRWEPLRAALDDPDDSFFDHEFELSVGYDLEGVQSEKMDRFLGGIRDVRGIVDRLRGDIPAPFAAVRDTPVPDSLVRMTNLSTFHGCPPEEIEGIVRHLMTAHGLDVTVKLNPTLLGEETVRGILHDRLGYDDVTLVPDAFAQDLKFDRALEMIASLRDFAAAKGRTFGVKLTNTLVVANERGVLPEERMYLSGAPLHTMAVTLLDRLVEAMPGAFAVGGADGPVPVAFSAGIDKTNLEASVALGLAPVTICSDLLRPGGYGRQAQGLRALARRLKDENLADLAGLRAAAGVRARQAGHRDAIAARAAELATPEGAAPYAKVAGKALRTVDADLQMFDCVACGNCVSVCPNNAFVAVPTGDLEGLAAREQYLVLGELCNDCGNCTTFCPERGAPQRTKPRLYTQPQVWELEEGAGFLLERADDGLRVRAGSAESPEAAARLESIAARTGGDALPLRCK